jgi:hypothetical protein
MLEHPHNMLRGSWKIHTDPQAYAVCQWPLSRKKIGRCAASIKSAIRLGGGRDVV